MYQLRGFVPISAFSDNAEGKVAAIGELSSLSRSFSRDVNFIRVAESPDVALAVFNNTRDGVVVDPEVVYYTLLLNVSQWIFTQSISGDLSKDQNTLLQNLNAAFTTRAKFSEVGEIVSNGRYWFPSYIVCSALESTDADSLLKVWYTDDAFRREYDLFEHVISPPPTFDNIDDFFLPAATVITRIKAMNAETVNTQNNKYRGDYPETKLITTNYDYVSPLDETDTYPTPWSAFVYALAGISADSLRDSVVDYILKNSTHTRDEWEKIFPDLFTPTEFYIIPYWDKYSLPDNQLVAGFYSPTVPLKSQLKTAKKYAFGTDYTDAHLTDNLCISGNLYRSMQFLSIGNPKNRNAPTDFVTLWPKYAMISTTAIDFGRIPPETRAFMIALTSLLQAAEVATAFSVIPEGMTRVVRNNVTYMTMVHAKVQYVIPAKLNFVSE